MRREDSTDPERMLAEATVAFVNRPLRRMPDLIELFAGHPWVAVLRWPAWQYHVEGKSGRLHPAPDGRRWRYAPVVIRDQAFIRKMLTAFVDNAPARRVRATDRTARRTHLELRAKRAPDVVATVRRQFWTIRGRYLVEDGHIGDAVLDFSFRREAGFDLDVHPVFKRPADAYWYGLALLLDHRRDFVRGLTVCRAPRDDGLWRVASGAGERECHRFFWRSRDRQSYCSDSCARIADKSANVRRQQLFRLRKKHGL